MQNKKRVGLLLFSTLFLLSLIPSVFALFEGIYYATYSFQDIVSIYQTWYGWIDFIVFFVIFASMSRIVFGKMFAKEGSEEEHPGLTGL